MEVDEILSVALEFEEQFFFDCQYHLSPSSHLPLSPAKKGILKSVQEIQSIIDRKNLGNMTTLIQYIASQAAPPGSPPPQPPFKFDGNFLVQHLTAKLELTPDEVNEYLMGKTFFLSLATKNFVPFLVGLRKKHFYLMLSFPKNSPQVHELPSSISQPLPLHRTTETLTS